jgi:arabinan endo-1,5-alpha-L-arabinosidase
MDRNILAIVSAIIALVGSLFQSPSAIGQEGDVVGVHDPCIIKEGANYYVFSTHGGIRVRKSSDLKNWERDGEVLPGPPAWAKQRVPGARDLWAPDISFFDGKYHLYYSISTFGKNRSCIGLATNKTLDRASALFHWVDEGFVIDSMPGRDDFNAIDPNVALDQDEEPWLSFGSYWAGIQMVRLDKKTGKPIGKSFLIAGRKGAAIEAPFIIRRGQSYYLFVSFDKCCQGVNSTYKIMVGRSRDVAGPYTDYTGQKLLDGGGTVVLAGYGRFRGPGHNAVLREGNTDYLVHHFYDAENRGRSALQIRPLVWSTDGWPLAGEPIQPEVKQPRKESVVGSWQHSVNFDPGYTISLLPDGAINDKGTRDRWRFRGSSLQLLWYRKDAPGGVSVDDCLVSPDGSWYVGRNQQGTVVRGVRSP